MQRDDPSGIRSGGSGPPGPRGDGPRGAEPRGDGTAPAADGDAVLAALAHRLRARSERQQLLTERLRSGELRPGALADLAELAAAARRGVRDGDHILVMSGAAPAQRGGAAVPLGQALSSAVSASEAASRTVVPPAPSVSLDSAAEPVFGQILAELLAHAVIATGPGERLELHVRFAPDGGVVLELLCTQPARNRSPVDELDRTLAAGRPEGPVAPQEIGLYVAARLARTIGARLGIRSSAGTAGVPGLTPVAVLALPPTVLVGGRGGPDAVRTEGEPAPGTTALPLVDDGPDTDPDADRAIDRAADGDLDGEGEEPVTASVPATAEAPAPPWPPPARTDPSTGYGPPGGTDPAGPPSGPPPGPWQQRPGPPPGPRSWPPPARPTEGPPATEALPVAGSSPPAELFGPFDSEVPVPVDDLDGTPIFAAVASAWFRDPGAARRPPESAAPPAGGPQNWSSAGDAEFEAARQRANRVVETPTTAQGLPQRRPGQQMVPPPQREVPAGVPRHASSTERQPDRVRTRLASYQRGLREGRHRAAEENNTGNRGPWPNGQRMAPVPDGRSTAPGEPEPGPNGVVPYGRNGRNVS